MPQDTDTQLGNRLGSGKEAEVFAYGPHAIKLYRQTAPKRSAFREAANLALIEPLRLPAPVVHEVRPLGERWGVVMTRAEPPPLGELTGQGPDAPAVVLARMVALHRRIHAEAVPRLASLKTRLAANIRHADALDEARRRRLLATLRDMPDGDRLLHGDFHPLNVMGPPGREMVIDWLDAASGDPAADVCRSLVLIAPRAPEFAAAYVDAYATASGIGREAILAWIPHVAAGRLSEGVPEEADQLMAMVDGR